MGESSAQSFSLKILVAKDENKVIMAEADREFMEVLFRFMLMPIASVVKHTSTLNCLSGDIGCLNNLYESVKNFDKNFIQDEKLQSILLSPRSAAEIYCKTLEMDLTENGRDAFYVCDDKHCNVISFYYTGKCRCGNYLIHKLVIEHNSTFIRGKGDKFLKSTARFMITDDFKVRSVATDLNLLNDLGKYTKIEERSIKVGIHEVLNLLKCSLTSRTPLSETFLKPSIISSSNELVGKKYDPTGMNPPLMVKNLWKKQTNISFKLVFDKVNNKALYAVVNEDFVNLLFTFLTFPLGYIFNKFPLLSFNGCMGNLHKSIKETENNLFLSKKRKEILINPKLAPGLPYKSNLIDIQEANIWSESPRLSWLFYAKKKYMSSKAFGQNPQNVFEGFIKGPAMFLVMDNLEVEPLSPISIKLHLDKLMVPISDIDEQELILDEDKAMRLLAASVASQNALTSTFFHKEANVDRLNCVDFLRLMWAEKGMGSKGDKKA